MLYQLNYEEPCIGSRPIKREWNIERRWCELWTKFIAWWRHCGRNVHQKIYKYLEIYMPQLGFQAATIHTRDLCAARRNNSSARFHLFGTRLTRHFNDLTISQDIMWVACTQTLFYSVSLERVCEQAILIVRRAASVKILLLGHQLHNIKRQTDLCGKALKK